MVTRSALPQNFNVVDGSVIEAFDTISEWSETHSADSVLLESDSTYQKNGAGVKATVTNGYIYFKKTTNIDLRGKEQMCLWVYCHDANSATPNRPDLRDTMSTLDVILSETVDGSTRWQFQISGEKMVHGWNLIKIGPRIWNVAAGSPTWDANMVYLRFKLTSVAGQTTSITVADFNAGYKSIPHIMFRFDDGWIEQYSEAFAYMNPLGLRATIAVEAADYGGPLFCGDDEYQEMYDAGWAIANHTMSHSYLTSLTASEQAAEIVGMKAFLDGKGFTRCSDMVVYPHNAYNSDTLTVMAANAMKVGMSTRWHHIAGSTEQLYFLASMTPSSLSNAKTYIDLAISAGATLVLLFHIPHDMAGGIGVFRQIVDYVIQTGVSVITIDEWYNGLTNPRYRSLPMGRP